MIRSYHFSVTVLFYDRCQNVREDMYVRIAVHQYDPGSLDPRILPTTDLQQMEPILRQSRPTRQRRFPRDCPHERVGREKSYHETDHRPISGLDQSGHLTAHLSVHQTPFSHVRAFDQSRYAITVCPREVF